MPALVGIRARRYGSRAMTCSKRLRHVGRSLFLSVALFGCEPTGGGASPTASTAPSGAASSSVAIATSSSAAPRASAAEPPAQQPAPPTVAAMLELYASVSAGKPASDLWSEEAELTPVGSVTGTKRGRPAVLAYLEATKKAYPDLKIVPVRAWALSKTEVLLEGVFTGKNEGPLLDGTPATGKYVGGRIAHLATFGDDGKLRSVEVYENELNTVVQLGLIPSMGSFPPPVPRLPTAPHVLLSGPGDDSALALIKRIDAALYESRDLNQFAKLYAQDVKVGFPPMPQRSSLESRQNEARPFITANSGDAVEYVKTWNVGGHAIVLAKHSAKHVGKVGPFDATNKTFTRKYIQIARAEGGKVVSFTHHGNSLGPMMQLGLFPQLEPKK